MPKNRELKRLIKEGEDLGLYTPSDVVLDLAREEAQNLLSALKLKLNIRPQDLPLYTLTQPGAVPAPKEKGVILAAEGWEKIAAHTVYMGMGGGGGTMTAAQILAALLTVDGAGSLLDADLLDGNEAAAFALSGHLHAGVYEPADATILKSGNANWIDLTDGGSTNLHSHAASYPPNGTVQYQMLTTGPNPFAAAWSDFYIRGTTGGTVNLAVTNTKTLTLTSTGDFNLTIPATGTAALGTGTDTQVAFWSGTNTITGDADFAWNSTTQTLSLGGGSLQFTSGGAFTSTASLSYAASTSLTFSAGSSAILGYDVNITAGDATAGGDGGNIIITAGAGNGGNDGTIQFLQAGVGGFMYMSDVTSSRSWYWPDVTGRIALTGRTAAAVNTGTNNVVQFTIKGFTTQTTTNPLVRFQRNDAAAGVSNILQLIGLGSGAAGDGGYIDMMGKSSTTAATSMAKLQYLWATATHASRKARSIWSVFDTAEREGIRIEASGTAPMLGFYGHAAAAQASAYTPSNVTTDRSYDANATTIDEVADVLGTLIADLQAIGLIG